MRAINAIVIHCSATPNGRRVTVADVDKWHADFGFRRAPEWREKQNPELGHIGYHFLIYTTGTVATGRHLDEVGAHTQGNNSRTIGVCMAGMDAFTPAQWASLKACVRGLHKLYPTARVLGHRDYSPDLNGDGQITREEWTKTCPGFDVKTWGEGGMRPLEGHLLVDPAGNDPASQQPPEAA